MTISLDEFRRAFMVTGIAKTYMMKESRHLYDVERVYTAPCGTRLIQLRNISMKNWLKQIVTKEFLQHYYTPYDFNSPKEPTMKDTFQPAAALKALELAMTNDSGNTPERVIEDAEKFYNFLTGNHNKGKSGIKKLKKAIEEVLNDEGDE